MNEYFEKQLANITAYTLPQIVLLNQSRLKFASGTLKDKKQIRLISIDRVGRKGIYVILKKKNENYVEPPASLESFEIIEDESNPPSMPSKEIYEMVMVWDDGLDELRLNYVPDRMIGDIPVLVEKAA